MNTRIRELRKFLNLTLREFGERIGLKPSTISDIEQGRCNISERHIIAICSRFNVNETWLRTGEGEMLITNIKNYNEFFNIYNNLKQPLQDFLINCGKVLLNTQNKL